MVHSSEVILVYSFVTSKHSKANHLYPFFSSSVLTGTTIQHVHMCTKTVRVTEEKSGSACTVTYLLRVITIPATFTRRDSLERHYPLHVPFFIIIPLSERWAGQVL